MNNQTTTIIIVIVVVIAAYVFWQHCTVSCGTKAEGYMANALSSPASLKRTPVTFAFASGTDGFSENPHYYGNPKDRQLPLEIGAQNFYAREIAETLEPLHRLDTGACKTAKSCQYVQSNPMILNDGKTRLDIIESGDIEFYNKLANMHGKNYAKLLPGMIHYPYEIDAIYINPDDQPPLYSGSFHYNSILGH